MASDTSHKQAIMSDLQNKELSFNWEDVICPICLDTPHNAVLLQCSSYDKGCRPFMCDTDHTQSNCLDRFRSAYGLPASAKVTLTPNGTSGESSQPILLDSERSPTCPLCRGGVTGWVVIDEIRVYLNTRKRCCEEKCCSYVGNFLELQIHAQQEHPHARPSEVDPARKLDWDNFQQSSEIIDVLTTIDSVVPHGVLLGDYVIEYGDESGDEYEDFPGDDGNWWTSCILYQVFDNFRASRERQRSRSNETRGRHRSGYEAYLDEGSTSSVDIAAEYQFDGSDDEFMGIEGVEASRGSASHHSFMRRRSRFHDP